MVEALCEVDAAIGTLGGAALHTLHELIRTLLQDTEEWVKPVMAKLA